MTVEKSGVSLEQYLVQVGFTGALVSWGGGFERWDRGGDLNAWFTGRSYQTPSGELRVARFGDWRTGEKYEWRSHEPASPEEAADLQKALKEALETEKAERLKVQEETAALCLSRWNGYIPLGITPYMRRKKMVELHGCRVHPDDTGTLVVPARDASGKLWGLQYVQASGEKRLTSGMRIEGCFHAMGELTGAKLIYLCEGIATAASIHQALGQAPGSVTVSAFSAGNLPAVAKSLRKHCKEARIVICGDDDRFTTREGVAWNPGREYAARAAAMAGGEWRVPRFREGSPGTDYNDLACEESEGMVKEQLTEVNNVVEVIQMQGAIEILPVGRTKSGAPIPPTQEAISRGLLRRFHGRIMAQGPDLFEFVGTHWAHLSRGRITGIKSDIQDMCAGLATIRLIEDAFKMFTVRMPQVPENLDLFAPQAFAANFRNGTLHLSKNMERKYVTQFKPHRREDYLINLLPFDYPEPGSGAAQVRNLEFDVMLTRVFEGDADADQKIRAVRQMYGACLMPAFPHLFMCHGVPGTGKSTIINIAARLVSKENISGVQPAHFNGFNMEGLVGKLVNINTDISTTAPMQDDIIKRIVERKPFTIRRKGIKDIMAPIPSVHLFGGNTIPKALDGVSKAHDRRWTFLEFTKLMAKGVYDLEYWDYCFEQGPEGVLNFALEGLDDLCQGRGHFLNPASGVQKMAEWQMESDPVGQFLDDLREGEVSDANTLVSEDKEGLIERKKLWEVFKIWHTDTQGYAPKMGKIVFFGVLRQKKVGVKTINGVRYFEGVAVQQGRGSIC